VPPRRSAASRLFEFFHTHPRGRAYELLFFGAIGAAFIAAAYVGFKKDVLNEPIAWLVALVGACFVLFALLPQKKRVAPPAPPVRGKRGKIAEQVKASKAEKRKGPPPPIH
jgi:hypothetical protein